IDMDDLAMGRRRDAFLQIRWGHPQIKPAASWRRKVGCSKKIGPGMGFCTVAALLGMNPSARTFGVKERNFLNACVLEHAGRSLDHFLIAFVNAYGHLLCALRDALDKMFVLGPKAQSIKGNGFTKRAKHLNVHPR